MKPFEKEWIAEWHPAQQVSVLSQPAEREIAPKPASPASPPESSRATDMLMPQEAKPPRPTGLADPATGAPPTGQPVMPTERKVQVVSQPATPVQSGEKPGAIPQWIQLPLEICTLTPGSVGNICKVAVGVIKVYELASLIPKGSTRDPLMSERASKFDTSSHFGLGY